MVVQVIQLQRITNNENKSQTKQTKSMCPGLTGGSWAEGLQRTRRFEVRDEGFFFLRKKVFGMREWARSHFWAIIEKPTERKSRLHSEEWKRRTLVIHQELEELLKKKGKTGTTSARRPSTISTAEPPAKGKGTGVAVKGSLFSSFWWYWALKNRLNHKIPK